MKNTLYPFPQTKSQTRRLWTRLWAPLLVLTAILAGCGEAVTPEPAATPAPPAATPEPEPAEPTKPKRQATCDDSAIRLLDREAGVHGAIVDDTLHMGGATAPATCTDPTNESLHAGPSNTDDRTEQVRQSQYYLIVIRYPDGNRLYVISRRGDGTLCVVDTNDQCIAQVTALPDDYDVEDLPEDVPPEIPAGRPAPPTVSPPPASGGSSAPGRPSNPQPRDEATGVTVGGPLLSWGATPLALSYDVYWGATRELAADTALGTPINTSSTFLRISPSTDLADDTTYYWRVDAKNDAGATRGDVWSFTTGAALPNVAGIYEGQTTFVRTTAAEANTVREVVKVRDRYKVFQTTGAEDVIYYATVLEVLSGGDSLLRDLLTRYKGEPWSVGAGLVCALSPDGACRLCSMGHNPNACDQGLSGIGSITFKGSQLSHRLVVALPDGSNASVVGAYTIVADDPGSFQTPPLAPPSEPIDEEPYALPAPLATASSSASYRGQSASPDLAIDGDDDTFWCATRMPAWFRLDLGRRRNISSLLVDVHYHTVHGNVEVSTDPLELIRYPPDAGSRWTTVSSFDTTASDTGSGIDDSALKAFAVMRRIRMIQINFTQTDAPSSHVYQACISEVSASEVPQ